MPPGRRARWPMDFVSPRGRFGQGRIRVETLCPHNGRVAVGNGARSRSPHTAKAERAVIHSLAPRTFGPYRGRGAGFRP